MHDLLFRPASELAALVRSGEVSARELVSASLERIEALEPAAQRVRARRRRGRARRRRRDRRRATSGRSPACPIAIKDNQPVEGMRLTFGCGLFGDFVAPLRRQRSSRRLRDAGFVIVGKTTLPEYGILPSHRVAPLRADAQPVGPRAHAGRLLRRRGGGRRRRDGPDRARQRRRRLDPDPRRVLRPRRPQARARAYLDGARARRVVPRHRRRAHAHRRRHGGAARPARRPEPGDATWAPPPPEPFAQAAAREPGKLRIGVTLAAAAHGDRGRPDRRAGDARRRDAADRARPRGRGGRGAVGDPRRLRALLRRRSAPPSRSTIVFASAAAGREPQEQDMEPLSW